MPIRSERKSVAFEYKFVDEAAAPGTFEGYFGLQQRVSMRHSPVIQIGPTYLLQLSVGTIKAEVAPRCPHASGARAGLL